MHDSHVHCRPLQEPGSNGLIQPHGGSLVNLMVSDQQERQRLLDACGGRKIECSDRNACDLELLAVGGFSPLTGFMDEARCSVVLGQRLLWAMLLVCRSVIDIWSHGMVGHCPAAS